MIRTKKRMALCITWLVLNLMFIWGNSLLPGSVSGAFSNRVGSLLSQLISGGGAPEQGSGLLRKVAHFSEFALLGMCLRWLFGMVMQKPTQHLLLPVLSGVAVAFVDEGIQMFVPDRGPGLLDVGIDSSGLILGVAIVSILYFRKKSKTLEETKQ